MDEKEMGKALGIPPQRPLTPEEFRRQMVYAAFMFALGLFCVTIANVLYTNYVDQKSNQIFCETLEALDIPPPVNAEPRVRDINVRVHRLNVKLGCVRD